jgi:hypothetical protein
MDLPPIGNSKYFNGFILSCRQAYLEAEETASKIVNNQLQRLKTRVEAETGVPVELPYVSRDSGFAELRDVSIAIPYAALGMSDNKDEVHVQALRITGTLLLFPKNHFNKVNVTFHGDDQTTGFASQRERVNFMWHLGVLGWGLADKVLNSYDVNPWDGDIPNASINTNQFVLAWDPRNTSNLARDSTLNGQRFQHAAYTKECDKENRPWYRHLYGDNYLVGEKVFNGCNQQPLQDWETSYTLLTPYCGIIHPGVIDISLQSSAGIGKACISGFTGMSKEEFYRRQEILMRR